MNYAQMVLDELDRSVKNIVEGRKVAIMFSGGLDSGVLAAISAKYADTFLYTVGVEGAHDLVMSEEASRLLAFSGHH